VVAFAVAAGKLGEDSPRPPASVAEALAMHAVLAFAADLLVDGSGFGLSRDVPPATAQGYREDVEDVLFEDWDFLLLYEGRADGLGADPEEPLGRLLGTVNLAYEDWFRPLPGHAPHPYFEGPPDSGADEDEELDLPWF